MPLEPFVSRLCQAIAAGCRQRDLPWPALILEPGRSLVAQAGVALYTVGGRKVIPNSRTFVSIDGGLPTTPARPCTGPNIAPCWPIGPPNLTWKL
jgi:diaminopimelate decarboxylase